MILYFKKLTHNWNLYHKHLQVQMALWWIISRIWGRSNTTWKDKLIRVFFKKTSFLYESWITLISKPDKEKLWLTLLLIQIHKQNVTELNTGIWSKFFFFKDILWLTEVYFRNNLGFIFWELNQYTN